MRATIRTKPLHDSKLRIYIDYYPAILHPITGKPTRREVLALSLFSEEEYSEQEYTTNSNKRAIRISPVLDNKGNPKKIKLTPLQREHNKKTLILAENIKAQRQLQIQQDDYGFMSHNKNADFLAFFKGYADEHLANGDTNYLAAYNFLKTYSNENCPVKLLTPDFCEGFRDYLTTAKPFVSTKTKLANTSMIAYWGIFKMVLKKAVQKKLIKTNPAADIKGIGKAPSPQREFLTHDELIKIANAPCDLPEFKSASLFSVFTGLRHSDICKLTWGEILEENGKYSIRLTIKKTKEAETMPISVEAYNILGDRKANHQKVFPTFKYGQWQNSVILRWIHGAGVNKHITFHCFRHTFATLQLSLGTDLYMVSKMLGHKNITTTQIYAKIIDEKKREAANKITLIL